MTSEPSTLFDDLDLPRPVPGGDVDERGIPLWATADGGADTAGGPGRPTDSDGRLHDPEELLKGLNPQQREAVVHDGPPLLIVAGAGSGKTRVLTHRIAYLLAARHVQPGQVLAITFTNKAAGEMKERVADLIGPRAKAMWVMTFHSACVRILRREATRLGLKSTFSIYDAADSQRLMTLVLRDLDLDPKRYQPRAFSHAVSNLKNDLVDEEAYASRVLPDDSGSSHHERKVSEAYSAYQRRLRQANAMDFDDLIMSTVHLLQAFPDAAEHYRRRFRHILVDEYQDTNVAQYQLVKELVGPVLPDDAPAHAVPPGELCVVGDADQSIYAFRGATIRNIVEFEQDYPQARTILLEQNYRSTQTILRAANAVIARNEKRRAKNLWTDSGDGVKIVGYVGDSEHDEAAFVAKQIDHLQDTEGVRPKDVAIFYRTNAQSRAFEEVLVRVGMPYKVVGGTRFYERKEIKDAARLPAGHLEPRRHRQPAADHQRAEARHRRARGGLHRPAGRARAHPVRRGPGPAGRRPGHRDPVGGGHRGVHRAAGVAVQGLGRRLRRRRAARGGRRAERVPRASSGPAPTPRTRPGSRTSPSWSRSPVSSTRSGSRPARSSRWRTSSSASRWWPTPTTSRPTRQGPTAASSP